MKVIVLLADGFEEIEAITQIDLLRRAEITVQSVSIGNDLIVYGAHGVCIKADILLDDIKDTEDILGAVIPGGMPGSTNLRDDDRVIDLLRHLNDSGKTVAAICAGPIVLERAGILKGKKVTSFPGIGDQLTSKGEYSEEKVVQDQNVFTSRGPNTAIPFALQLIESMKGSEVRKDIEEQILYN